MSFVPLCLLLLLAAPALAPGAERLAVGLTAGSKQIEAGVLEGPAAGSPSVLLIGGLAGEDASAAVVRREVQKWRRLPPARRRFRLISIPLANPDRSTLSFPPAGQAYRDHPESHALWRWIGIHAPDLVLVAGSDDGGLAPALAANPVAGVGAIPARRVDAKAGLLASLPAEIPASEAHREIEKRLARSPRQVAEQLSAIYGQELNEVVYIPAVALIGRLRLGQLAAVEQIVAPYRDGAKDSLARATASHLAGHLIFAELAERTGNPRYTDLVRRAAALAFTPAGEMREAMPMHSEMSDAVFMGCPILAKAGKLTHDPKYFEMAVRHL
ncbi:MAG TPA: hypothetical protein VG672_18915, partial [Bryobacteraceae bacterium]|nr:hypothetical protein [Bryobacteraceae bacterium]